MYPSSLISRFAFNSTRLFNIQFIRQSQQNFSLSKNEPEQTDLIKIVEKGGLSKVKSEPKQVSRLKIERSRIKVNPEDTTILLFPGQGSQYVGMGSNVFQSPNVEKLYAIAKSILGYDLLKLCLNGPIEDLNKTEHCQPAIFVTSLAAVEHLRSINSTEVETCVATAGFSIGEITSLVFAGAMSFEDGLRLVKIRAEAMQYASEMIPSSMATVFYNADAQISLACQAAREWCKRIDIEEEHSVCSVANHLFPHCKVIAGHEEAIKFLELNGKDFGFKKLRRLPVSGAFHTNLMKPVKNILEEALNQIKLEIPLIPVFSNYDGKIYRSEDQIRKNLSLQVCNPVKWEQILHKMYDRTDDVPFPKTYECGPGTALLSTLAMVNRLARKNSKHVKV